MNAVAQKNAGRVDNPFGTSVVAASPEGASAAAVAQREVAEVQAAMAIAKRFPRDQRESMDRILNACMRPLLAEDATYEYTRGGEQIAGASIRLAEQLARDWGNIQCGVIELSRGVGSSEVLAYAWDLETNFREEKRFMVRHWRDTKKGGYAVKDERDIYEIIANVAARRKRACILAVIPGDVQEAALRQCEKTLKDTTNVTPEMIQALVTAFTESYGVTKEMIEKRIQRHLDAMTSQQVLQMRRIFASLRDGMGKVEDYFEIPADAQAPAPTQTAEGSPTSPGGSAPAVETKTQAVKNALKSKASPPAEQAAAATPASAPPFDVPGAIAHLKGATDIKSLDERWKAVSESFIAEKRELTNEVHGAYTDRKAALEQL